MFSLPPTVSRIAKPLRKPMASYTFPRCIPQSEWVGCHLDNLFKAKNVKFRWNSMETRNGAFRNHEIWQGLLTFSHVTTHVISMQEPCAIQWFSIQNEGAVRCIPQGVWAVFHLDNLFKAKRVAFRVNSVPKRKYGTRNHQIWQGICMFLHATLRSNTRWIIAQSNGF